MLPHRQFCLQTIIGLLELPEHLKPVLMITLGYPDEEPPATTRLSLKKPF
jgi:nitroreductase